MSQNLQTVLGRKPVIMIVDDDEDLVLVMQMKMQMEGFEVMVSINALRLFELLEERQPDVILLDISMRGEDGFAICKRLKGGTNTTKIPVMMFSANPNLAEIADGCGADGYISKPFKIEDLKNKLGELIDQNNK
jgi:two-component system, OmpR family, response regulator VicR